jgi:hypothetical protein
MMTDAGPRMRLADDCRPGQRIFRDVDRAAADDRTAARASAEFRQSHSYRHNSIPVSDRPVGWIMARANVHRRCGSKQQMQTIPLSASAFTILMPQMPRIRASWRPSVPLLNSFFAGVNGIGGGILAAHG